MIDSSEHYTCGPTPQPVGYYDGTRRSLFSEDGVSDFRGSGMPQFAEPGASVMGSDATVLSTVDLRSNAPDYSAPPSPVNPAHHRQSIAEPTAAVLFGQFRPDMYGSHTEFSTSEDRSGVSPARANSRIGGGNCPSAAHAAHLSMKDLQSYAESFAGLEHRLDTAHASQTMDISRSQFNFRSRPRGPPQASFPTMHEQQPPQRPTCSISSQNEDLPAPRVFRTFGDSASRGDDRAPVDSTNTHDRSRVGAFRGDHGGNHVKRVAAQCNRHPPDVDIQQHGGASYPSETVDNDMAELGIRVLQPAGLPTRGPHCSAPPEEVTPSMAPSTRVHHFTPPEEVTASMALSTRVHHFTPPEEVTASMAPSTRVHHFTPPEEVTASMAPSTRGHHFTAPPPVNVPVLRGAPDGTYSTDEGGQLPEAPPPHSVAGRRTAAARPVSPLSKVPTSPATYTTTGAPGTSDRLVRRSSPPSRRPPASSRLGSRSNGAADLPRRVSPYGSTPPPHVLRSASASQQHRVTTGTVAPPRTASSRRFVGVASIRTASPPPHILSKTRIPGVPVRTASPALSRSTTPTQSHTPIRSLVQSSRSRTMSTSSSLRTPSIPERIPLGAGTPRSRLRRGSGAPSVDSTTRARAITADVADPVPRGAYDDARKDAARRAAQYRSRSRVGSVPLNNPARKPSEFAPRTTSPTRPNLRVPDDSLPPRKPSVPRRTARSTSVPLTGSRSSTPVGRRPGDVSPAKGPSRPSPAKSLQNRPLWGTNPKTRLSPVRAPQATTSTNRVRTGSQDGAALHSRRRASPDFTVRSMNEIAGECDIEAVIRDGSLRPVHESATQYTDIASRARDLCGHHDRPSLRRSSGGSLCLSDTAPHVPPVLAGLPGSPLGIHPCVQPPKQTSPVWSISEAECISMFLATCASALSRMQVPGLDKVVFTDTAIGAIARHLSALADTVLHREELAYFVKFANIRAEDVPVVLASSRPQAISVVSSLMGSIAALFNIPEVIHCPQSATCPEKSWATALGEVMIRSVRSLAECFMEHAEIVTSIVHAFWHAVGPMQSCGLTAEFTHRSTMDVLQWFTSSLSPIDEPSVSKIAMDALWVMSSHASLARVITSTPLHSNAIVNAIETAVSYLRTFSAQNAAEEKLRTQSLSLLSSACGFFASGALDPSARLALSFPAAVGAIGSTASILLRCSEASLAEPPLAAINQLCLDNPTAVSAFLSLPSANLSSMLVYALTSSASKGVCARAAIALGHLAEDPRISHADGVNGVVDFGVRNDRDPEVVEIVLRTIRALCAWPYHVSQLCSSGAVGFVTQNIGAVTKYIREHSFGQSSSSSWSEAKCLAILSVGAATLERMVSHASLKAECESYETSEIIRSAISIPCVKAAETTYQRCSAVLQHFAKVSTAAVAPQPSYLPPEGSDNMTVIEPVCENGSSKAPRRFVETQSGPCPSHMLRKSGSFERDSSLPSLNGGSTVVPDAASRASYSPDNFPRVQPTTNHAVPVAHFEQQSDPPFSFRTSTGVVVEQDSASDGSPLPATELASNNEADSLWREEYARQHDAVSYRNLGPGGVARPSLQYNAATYHPAGGRSTPVGSGYTRQCPMSPVTPLSVSSASSDDIACFPVPSMKGHSADQDRSLFPVE